MYQGRLPPTKRWVANDQTQTLFQRAMLSWWAFEDTHHISAPGKYVPDIFNRLHPCNRLRLCGEIF